MIPDPMRHELIRMTMLSALLALAPHTHAKDSDRLGDLTAKAETGDADAQLALAIRYREDDGVKSDACCLRWEVVSS